MRDHGEPGAARRAHQHRVCGRGARAVHLRVGAGRLPHVPRAGAPALHVLLACARRRSSRDVGVNLKRWKIASREGCNLGTLALVLCMVLGKLQLFTKCETSLHDTSLSGCVNACAGADAGHAGGSVGG